MDTLSLVWRNIWRNPLRLILKLLVQRIRQAWPEVKIIFRADSGFCRNRILTWCDRRHS